MSRTASNITYSSNGSLDNGEVSLLIGQLMLLSEYDWLLFQKP